MAGMGDVFTPMGGKGLIDPNPLTNPAGPGAAQAQAPLWPQVAQNWRDYLPNRLHQMGTDLDAFRKLPREEQMKTLAMSFGPGSIEKLGGETLGKLLSEIAPTVTRTEGVAASRVPNRYSGGIESQPRPDIAGQLPGRKEASAGLRSVKTMPKDQVSDLFDLSRLSEVPAVPQYPMTRYVPKGGVSARMSSLVTNPDVVKQMQAAIEHGVSLGGKEWYNTQPLYHSFVNELGPNQGPVEYKRFMDYVSATSPRSDVVTNIRNASFYHWLEGQGVDPRHVAENPYPYGHLAQDLHKQNASNILAGGMDPIKNPKPPSFVENLTGNQMPGTMDAHAIKAPAMFSQDPRFLETGVRNKIGTDLDTGKDLYGTVHPRTAYAHGDFPMSHALTEPTWWAGIPKANEYGALENFYKDRAREQGLTTAQAQASSWIGAGKMTGLGSPPLPFMHLLDYLLRRTSAIRGETPALALKKMIRRQAPLLTGAGVTAATAGSAGLGDAFTQDGSQ